MSEFEERSMIKTVLVIWILAGGAGISYSVITERRNRLLLLKTMEYCLKLTAYYMYDWRMPVEEMIKKVSEEAGVFTSFYQNVGREISEKNAQNFGEIWKAEGRAFLKEKKISEDIKGLWAELFLHMPMEPEGVNKKVLLKYDELRKKRADLEERYKGEQRLVFTMGLFVSAFLCLILW